MDQPSPEGSVTVMIGRLKAGDPEAAKPLWDGYFRRLVSLARGRLRSTSRVAADEEDVALSAFNSFCQGVTEGRFPRLDDRDDLWQVLFVLTTRKAIGQVRHETRDKRDNRRALHASVAGAGIDSDVNLLDGQASPEPSPEFAAEVAEECSRLLAMLGDGQLRQLAIWKMEGFTNAEIAVKIDKSVPTVERKLAAIRVIWELE
ncbi:MAG: RNA polymerase subunit sigma-70 [Planctomycetaceae bacterium]|nr:RNA polymerase subunit sigma-70 [Planctomycetaceae bacterium]